MAVRIRFVIIGVCIAALLALGFPGVPALAAGSDQTDITYCSIDGVDLKLDLHYPSDTTSAALPLIIWVHGGGWTKGDKTTVWGRDLMPSHGYILASLDYRLAPQYAFPAMIIDVKCALRFLKANATQYRIDAARIGLIGGSAGGHLVSLMGVTTSQDDKTNQWLQGQWTDQDETVRAVVDLYGPADLPAFPVKNAGPMKGVFDVTGKDDPKLALASPVTYIAANAKSIPPFLIIQGEKDVTVPPSQSKEFYQKLVAAGVKAQLVMVANAGHGFAPTPAGAKISPSRPEIEQKVIDFFDSTVKAVS